jgi:DNA polymerase III epsilon subunit-like protein
MIDLFFDTETTGFAKKDLSGKDPKQCGLIQLGMQVYDNRYPVFEMSTLIKCDKPIDPGAQKAHGISADVVRRHGRNPKNIADIFIGWVKIADRIVAHNIKFDINIINLFLNSLDMPEDFTLGKETYCTMQKSTDVCNIPGPYGKKWPKLIEAYKVLVDENGFEGAHNALVDVNACAKIFYALEDNDLLV